MELNRKQKSEVPPPEVTCSAIYSIILHEVSWWTAKTLFCEEPPYSKGRPQSVHDETVEENTHKDEHELFMCSA